MRPIRDLAKRNCVQQIRLCLIEEFVLHVYFVQVHVAVDKFMTKHYNFIIWESPYTCTYFLLPSLHNLFDDDFRFLCQYVSVKRLTRLLNVVITAISGQFET